MALANLTQHALLRAQRSQSKGQEKTNHAGLGLGGSTVTPALASREGQPASRPATLRASAHVEAAAALMDSLLG